MGWIVLTAALALAVLVLGLYLLSLRRSLGEVAEELEEKEARCDNSDKTPSGEDDSFSSSFWR